MDRRDFIGALVGVMGAGVGRSYFDIGGAWRKRGSGIYFREGDLIQIEGCWAVNPVTGRLTTGLEQIFMVTDDVPPSAVVSLPVTPRRRWSGRLRAPERSWVQIT